MNNKETLQHIINYHVEHYNLLFDSLEDNQVANIQLHLYLEFIENLEAKLELEEQEITELEQYKLTMY